MANKPPRTLLDPAGSGLLPAMAAKHSYSREARPSRVVPRRADGTSLTVEKPGADWRDVDVPDGVDVGSGRTTRRETMILGTAVPLLPRICPWQSSIVNRQ